MSFFKFPRDKTRCQKWLQQVDRQDLLSKWDDPEYCHRNLMLCSDHFEEKMFREFSEKKRLAMGAYPTRFRCCSHEVMTTESSNVETPTPPPQLHAPPPPPPPPPPSPPPPVPPAPTPPSTTSMLNPCLDEISPLDSFDTKRSTDFTATTTNATGMRTSTMKTSNETPRKAKLRLRLKKVWDKVRTKNKAIRRLQKEVDKSRKVSQIIETLKDYLSEDEHAIVSMQLKLSVGKKPRYTEEFKSFAVSVYYKSPSCYRFLQTRFKLPCKSTINLWLSKLAFQDGFCPNLMKMLSLRTLRLPESERLCLLIADEISLKKSVDYSRVDDRILGVKINEEGEKEYMSSALTFMVSGIRSKWKQAFYFSYVKNAMTSDELWPTLQEILTALHSIGLTVIVFVTDQGSNFHPLKMVLGVSPSRPFFIFQGNKIFSMEDTPHLIKSSRNCLLNNDIESSLGTAKWSHILEFYEQDKEQPCRLAPKLTDKHFLMKLFGAKMKVKWASQVFSHTVAAAVATYAQFGKLPAEAQATSAFLVWLNHLFDVLNSGKVNG